METPAIRSRILLSKPGRKKLIHKPTEVLERNTGKTEDWLLFNYFEQIDNQSILDTSNTDFTKYLWYQRMQFEHIPYFYISATVTSNY